MPIAVGSLITFTKKQSQIKASFSAVHIHKTAAQTALRFLLQSEVIVIPKSVRRERMEENMNVFDFSLSADEMSEIAALDENESAFFSHYDPDTVEYLTGLAR